MELRTLGSVEAFTTKDGSTIRELHHTGAQSLAEATLRPGQAARRHYHRASEEIYCLLAGEGELEVDGEARHVGVGDAVLIRPGAWHTIRNDGPADLRFLCCCSPPYSHEDTFLE